MHPVTLLISAFFCVCGVLYEQENNTLRELNLEGNKIRDGGATALGAALAVGRRSGCVLRVCLVHTELVCGLLFLFLSTLTPGNYAQNALFLCCGVQENKTLQTLNLQSNKIGPESAKAIGDALAVRRRCA